MTATDAPADRDIALVIGAGSTIARAVARALLEGADSLTVITISRSREGVVPGARHLACDNSPGDIGRVIDELQPCRGHIRRVIICQGILHSDTVQPEKKLEELDPAIMHRVLDINSVIPMLWVSRLLPLLRCGGDCVMAVFSARVGSITDNRKGGWYSYRASKAALNMLLKTAAVEYARRARNVKLLSFHPGTVDTPLSAPFQRSVPAGRLFTSGYVAGRLLQHMDGLSPDGRLSFLDWDGRTIDW